MQGYDLEPEMEKDEKRTPPAVAERLIQRLGGTSETARKCGIKPASVSGWKKNGIDELRTDWLRARYPEAFIEPPEPPGEPIEPSTAAA